MIATKSLAKAFSYVAALIPREVLELAVRPVTEKVAAIFQLCMGDLRDDTDAVARIGIAPAFSGCGARIEGIELQADAAFYSTCSALSKRMCSLLDSKGWPRRTMSGEFHVLRAQQRLLPAGVLVDLKGLFTSRLRLNSCSKVYPSKKTFPCGRDRSNAHQSLLQSE